VLNNVKTDTGNLASRITATLFSGITSLAQWFGLMAGKQTGDGTARTELRATGAGSGTYDETSHSQEATVDRGNAAWITATGFNTVVPDISGTAATLHGVTDGKIDTVGTNVDAILVDTGTTLPASIAALPTAVQNADALLIRSVSNTEDAAGEHTLTGIILAMLESSITDTTWTIRKTGGDTFATKTVTKDANADPITGVT
jgi:hypothetical protein